MNSKKKGFRSENSCKETFRIVVWVRAKKPRYKDLLKNVENRKCSSLDQ